MTWERYRLAWLTLAVLLLGTASLSAQDRHEVQWQLVRLIEPPPREDTLDEALQSLGLPFENIDALLHLTEPQKRAVIEIAGRYRKAAWSAVIELLNDQTKVVARRFVQRRDDLGGDLALMDLTDPQVKTLTELGRTWRRRRAELKDPDARTALDARMTIEARAVLEAEQVFTLERLQALRRVPTYCYVPFVDGKPGRPLTHRRHEIVSGITAIDLERLELTGLVRSRAFSGRLHGSRVLCLVDGNRVGHDKLVPGRRTLVITGSLVGRYATMVVQDARPLEVVHARLAKVSESALELSDSLLETVTFDKNTLFRTSTNDTTPERIEPGSLVSIVFAHGKDGPAPLAVLDHVGDRGVLSSVSGRLTGVEPRPKQKDWYDINLEGLVPRTVTVKLSPAFTFHETVDGAPRALSLEQVAAEVKRLGQSQVTLYGYALDETSTPVVYQGHGPARREDKKDPKP